MTRKTTVSSPSVVDVVWDGGTHGTALARTGRRLTVGTGADWSADDLLSLAAITSAMDHFLALADEAALDVSAYVGSGTIETAPDGTRHLVLSPCVMVARPDDVEAALQLVARTTAEAPLLAWVDLPVHVRPHVHPPLDHGQRLAGLHDTHAHGRRD